MEKPGGGKGEAERREEEERKKGLLHKTHQRICAVQMGIVWKKKKQVVYRSKKSNYAQNNSTTYEIFGHVIASLLKKTKSYYNRHLKETTQDYYMVLTVADHAGLVSVKLDYFCYFGAELNFFVKLRRTKRSHYINDETTAYFIHILVGG